MAEFFQNIDVFLFKIINSSLANPLFDKIMPFITERDSWILIYVLLIIALIWKGGRKGIICLIFLLIGIAITDQVSSKLLKGLFERLRPCFTLENVRLLVDCGPGKSFPSSHAANNFFLATILAYFYNEYKYILFIIAAAIAFSRVYVGVHYPFDITGGAVLGVLIGYAMALLAKLALEKFALKKNELK